MNTAWQLIGFIDVFERHLLVQATGFAGGI